MRSLRYIVAVFVVVGLAVVPACTQDKPQEDDIAGYYTWEGMKDGEEFLITKQGEVYRVHWVLKTGEWIGAAMRDGDRAAIGWDFPNGGNLGVSLYKIEKGKPGPTLVGGWTSYNSTKAGKDSYKWSKKAD